jgi:MtN3 and saliva related transmembrane protein
LAWEEILGWIAGALVTFSLIPQIIRVFKLKSAREISLAFNSLLFAGTLLWLGYGIAKSLLPVIVYNTTGALLIALLLAAKLRYGMSSKAK